MFKKLALGVLLCTVGCGQQDKGEQNTPTSPDSNKLQELEQGFLGLQGQLQALVQSDFATCSGTNVPNNSLIQTVCQIAQGATNETRVELKDSINTLSNVLNAKINSTQADVATLVTSWQQIFGVPFPATTGAPTPTVAECQANSANASLVQCMIVTAGQIVTINSQIAAIGTTLTGVPFEVVIGKENIALGPIYESVIRLGSGLQINAYMDGNGVSYTLANNPMAATNGAATLVVTAANSLSNGNYVRVQQCSSGRGLTAQQLFGLFTVSAVAAGNFTITAPANATSTGTLGGSTCIIQPFTGSGMSTIWTSPTAADVAVRVASQGSSSYNWVIMKPASGTFSGQGLVCYDKTVALQTFANIATAGMQTAINAAVTLPVTSGNLICK